MIKLPILECPKLPRSIKSQGSYTLIKMTIYIDRLGILVFANRFKIFYYILYCFWKQNNFQNLFKNFENLLYLINYHFFTSLKICRVIRVHITLQNY